MNEKKDAVEICVKQWYLIFDRLTENKGLGIIAGLLNYWMNFVDLHFEQD